MSNDSQPNIDSTDSHEQNPFQSPSTSGNSQQLRVLGAFWMALALAVAVGVLLIGIDAPGLAMFWGMLVIPGFLRAYIRLNRQRQELGATQPAGYQLLIAALSVLLVLPLMLTSLIAGGVVCTAGAVMASGLFPNDAGLLVAFGGGAVALLAIYISGFVWSLRWRIPLETKPPENRDEP